MSMGSCDIALVGGGLAGGLAALALARARPDLAVRLIEAGPAIGGNHRWSWFASDVDMAGEALLAAIPHTRWDDGYDVLFPAHRRHLATPYRSIASSDFAAALARELPAGTIMTGTPVAALEAAGVTLPDGGRLAARCVIDCRGFDAGLAGAAGLTGGWQVFMGRHIRLAAPHGIARPVIMDAAVAQRGGYRFVYLLPLGDRELFVEDTYYQDSPVLDEVELARRLDEYMAARGWEGEIVASETGVLPVVSGGDFARWQAANAQAGVGRAGALGGFLHPLTSYTLPIAVRTALSIASQADLPGDAMAAMLQRRADELWRAMRFYRMLAAMLFGAARPEERYRIFERFYCLPAPLIERFYAGRSTPMDKARILCGKPPVPIGRAMHALARPGRKLGQELKDMR